MKGLLHRLAARAAGTATVVRSDARLPYAADRLAWDRAAEDPLVQAAEPAVSDAAPAPVATPAMRSNVEPPEQGVHEGARSRAQAALLPGVHERSLPSHPQSLREASTGTIEPMTPPALTDTLSRIDPPQRTVSLAAAAETVREPMATPAEAPSAAAKRPAVSARNALPQPQAIESTARPASTDPAPLLSTTAAVPRSVAGEPRTSITERQQIAWPLAPSVASSPAASDAPNEVHIHIGRIEVTAVHEAPKARVKPGAKSPASSLDAYLDARSRR